MAERTRGRGKTGGEAAWVGAQIVQSLLARFYYKFIEYLLPQKNPIDIIFLRHYTNTRPLLTIVLTTSPSLICPFLANTTERLAEKKRFDNSNRAPIVQFVLTIFSHPVAYRMLN